MSKPLLIIQTGEAPQPILDKFGGFAQWFRVSMRLRPGQARTVRVDAGGKLPKSNEIAGAVITGSGAMVTDRERWSEDTAAWLRNAMDAQLPLFGVCYGHQLLAHALGGTVGWLPAGREIGTQPIARNGHADAWLDGMPSN
ncbi:MAG: gamma-glutamyl-gamma-aminobutyrate hydrolase family protein, partial [Proteobacteria bacterium]|nr:gamma-glutamyl-gamma-aminobutyrate hydrolase family protein [Pseudomonadota bacterium]